MQNRQGQFLYFPALHFCLAVCNRPFIFPQDAGWVIQVHKANTHSSPSYHFSHDTWLSSATPLSRAGHSGIWLMLSPSVVICLICPAFWDVSKTSMNVSRARPQLGSTWLAGWYLPLCFIYSFSYFLFSVFVHGFPPNLSCFIAWNTDAEAPMYTAADIQRENVVWGK